MNCNLERVWKKYSSLLPTLIKTFSRSASSRVCQTNARKGIEEISLTLVSCLWPSRPAWQQASLSPVIPRSWLAKNNPTPTTQEASNTTSSLDVCCCLINVSIRSGVVWGHWSIERGESEDGSLGHEREREREREREYQVMSDCDGDRVSGYPGREAGHGPRQAAFYIQQIQLRKIESLCGEEL